MSGSQASTDRPTPGSRRPRLGRRELAGLAAAAAAAPVVGLVPMGPASAGEAGAGGGRRRLRLRPDPGSVVSALEVPLAHRGAQSAVGRPVRTAVLETSEFSMLGVTWQQGHGTVRARTRGLDGSWRAWRTLPALGDGPDPDSDEGRRTPHATEASWCGASDAVQVEISGTARRPVLALIDPGHHRGDTQGAGLGASTGPAGKRGRTPRPPMRSRKDWRPNKRFLNGKPGKIKGVRQVHVHHTVNANDYGKSDVPRLIRGMYRYHTQSLGWADIGYNFLVDRFGRIWVGRKGSESPRKRVRGAHTLGFNDYSVGVSVIGNFETARPSGAVLDAIARVAAWQLDHYGRDPLGTIRVRSTGSDKYPAGRRPRLPVIDGHRDTNDTACPGRNLYAQLPKIRRRTARRIAHFA